QLACEHRPARKQRETQDHPTEATRRDVDHDEKEAKVEQSSSEVALEDEHAHRGHPSDDYRAQISSTREPHPEHLLADEREAFAVFHEVAREEDRECDFRELTGLEREGAEANP